MKASFKRVLYLPTLLVCCQLAYCMLGSILPANAQSADSLVKLKNANPQQRARMQSDLMKTRLALSDAQYKQVAALNLAYALKIEPILKSDDSKFSKYGRIKPLLEEKDEKLKTVFTKEQYDKYDAVKKEIMDKMREFNKYSN
ncbi:MAG: hypothetical protein P4L51_24815 [Puia sp.]|nr:hypothetical protein [Puia sp.]